MHRARTCQLIVSLNKGELALVNALAQRTRLSRPEFMRQLIFDFAARCGMAYSPLNVINETGHSHEDE